MSYEGKEGHGSDFKRVFENIFKENPEFAKLGKLVSSQMADNIPFLKTLPPAPDRLKIDHRSLFHWGFSGDIPFNQEGPLKSYLDKFPPNKREEIKNLIRAEWKNRVNQATDQALQILRWPPEARLKAKALLGLFYDTHLLGDLKPGNTMIESVQNIKSLEGDIVKNVKRLFGKNHPIVKQLEEALKKIKISPNANPQKYAEALLSVLTELPFGKSLKEIDKHLGGRLSATVFKTLSMSAMMASKYNRLSESLSPKIKTTLSVAAGAALVSGLEHGWNVFIDEEDFDEAVAATLKDASLAGASTYIAESVIQNIGGGKYAITALTEGAKKSSAALSTQATGAFLNYGVATFIFDETYNVFHYMQGGIDRDQFIRETGHAAIKATASGGLAYATVIILQTSAGNPVVIAAQIAGYLIASKAITEYDRLDNRNYFFAEDVLGVLPLNMQHGITAFNLDEWHLAPSAFDEEMKLAPSAFDEDMKLSPSAFDENLKLAPSAFE